MVKKITSLKEFTATGEYASVNDPVTPAGGANTSRAGDKKNGQLTADQIKNITPTQPAPNGAKAARPGDNKNGQTPEEIKKITPEGKSANLALTSKLSASSAVKEAFAELFNDSKASTDFIEKAEVVFEVAINEHIAEIMPKLNETYESKLTYQMETFVEETTDKMDSYLDFVTETYMTDNEIAIDGGIKVEIAESLLTGMKTLLNEHNIAFDEDYSSTLTTIEEELKAANLKLTEAVDENINLRQLIGKAEEEVVFDNITENLTDIEKDKITQLIEDFSFTDIDEYKKKLTIVKESFFNNNKGKTTKLLSENYAVDDINPIKVDDTTNVPIEIKSYVDAIAKSL